MNDYANYPNSLLDCMNARNFLISSSAFPYAAYSIFYFWTYFYRLERIGESTQGYFLLASLYIFMLLSSIGWGIIFYKFFHRSHRCSDNNISLIFITLNLLAWLTWLNYGLVLEELPFKQNLLYNQTAIKHPTCR